MFAATAAVAMASKYLIHFRGRHIFNPANFALVAAFLILGSGRVDPLQFWWGPLSPALLIALLVIVTGAFLVLSTRPPAHGRAALPASPSRARSGSSPSTGHGFSANWHLGPVATSTSGR